MDNYYFNSIIERLSLEEIEVLNTLTKQSATNRLRAMMKKEIFDELDLSEAEFRKVWLRLEALNFIEITAGKRNHLIYVTNFGQQAIQTIAERGNE